MVEQALRRAVPHDPQNSVAWNNLGFVLLKRGTDFDRALVAANRALESTTDNFHLRETRGQMFVKLQRWQDAITDLEFARNGVPNAPAIHQALATAYEALRDTQLAAAHRRTGI